jgi:hypothetical protein
MSEEKYRLWKGVVMSLLVIAAFMLVVRLTNALDRWADNGRYAQYEYSKNAIVSPTGTRTIEGRLIFDTRTGTPTTIDE